MGHLPELSNYVYYYFIAPFVVLAVAALVVFVIDKVKGEDDE